MSLLAKKNLKKGSKGRRDKIFTLFLRFLKRTSPQPNYEPNCRYISVVAIQSHH